VWHPGKSIPVSDTLSRAPLCDPPNTSIVVNNLSLIGIRPDRLGDIRLATGKDSVLTELKKVIMDGWPNERSLVTSSISQYYSYRDELTVDDGIVLRGERVVIPLEMRSEIKRKVHAGHMGINSCLRRARELVYWPGMSNDIRQHVESCDVCATYSSKQPLEPLHLHDTPIRPFQKVGTDLFSLHEKNYLITVDYHSHFFEIDYLPVTTSNAIVEKMKHHFARHGIPDTVISDNGPQYSSTTFQKFSNDWGFVHEPICPGNSKANGAAEATVKVAKSLLRKCMRAGEDPYLGLCV